jgi:hypothetical protein
MRNAESETKFVMAATAAMLARTENRNTVPPSGSPGTLHLRKDLLNLIAHDATGEAVVVALNLDAQREARITSLATALHNYALTHPKFVEDLARLLEEAVKLDTVAYRNKGNSQGETEALLILGLISSPPTTAQ